MARARLTGRCSRWLKSTKPLNPNPKLNLSLHKPRRLIPTRAKAIHRQLLQTIVQIKRLCWVADRLRGSDQADWYGGSSGHWVGTDGRCLSITASSNV